MSGTLDPKLYNPLIYQESAGSMPGNPLAVGAGYQKSLVDIIASTDDIEKTEQKRNFPYFSGIMQRANLTPNQALDLLDDQEIAHIERINGQKRYELPRSSRAEYVTSRSYLEAALSLSINGFSVKQLSQVHKHITYADASRQSGGLLGGLLGGGKE